LQYNTESYTVYRNIFDQLVMRDPSSNKIVPWIATSWTTVNPTTWVFQIKQGVTFSDGTPLTGNDVAFSINRILNPALNSPQFANFSYIASAVGTTSTVTITTKTPSPTLLSYLTTLSIVPQAYVQKVGNAAFNLHPIGSGPYILSSWVQGSSVTLAANPNYWAGTPPYKKVVFNAVPSDATRLANIESGQANIALQLTPDDAVQLKSSSTVKVIASPTERVAYLALNVLGNTPTKSLDVRKAIAYAIDYPALITNLLNGYAKPVNEVLTPASFGYTTAVRGYSYDPAKARSLLAASGNPHPVLSFATSPSYPTAVIEAIQANLQAVGMTVNIVNTDQATYLQDVQSPSHNWGSVRYGIWSCSCEDADGTIYPLFHTGSIWSSYSNPAFDAAVSAARSTLDTTTRLADYLKAFQILQADVPGIGLWQYYSIRAVSKQISWVPGPQQTLFVDQIHWG
jgi:peptide/nickel transport system substrate-binding protein